MKNKIKFMIILSLFLLVLVVLNVSAYTKLCLSDCQGTPVDNPRYVCELGSMSRCDDPGYCEVCVTDSGNPTAPYRCAGQNCNFLGGDNNDSNPPNLIVNFPENNGSYNTKKVVFDLEVDSLSLIEYINLEDRKPQWKTLCNKCVSYNKEVKLNEGGNHILIKATKKANDLSDQEEIWLRIDTKKPRISKTYPKNNEYADGTFSVVYDENNLVSVKLYYGMSDYNVAELNGCSNGKKQTCSIDINLSEHEGHTLNYYFTVEDAASVVSSKVNTVNVDTIPPYITGLDYIIEDKSVTLDITTDSVARKIVYIDNDERNPKEKTLCSNKSVCTKKRNFKTGHHSLTIKSFDKAGNFDFRDIEFDIL